MTIYLQTIAPDTASTIDADSLPLYRVYGNLTSAPLTSGVFSLIDSANTEGFYAAQFVLSTTHGFSASGTYCVRKQATISSIVGAVIDVFRIYLS